MRRVFHAVALTCHLLLWTVATSAQPEASMAEASFRAGRTAMRAGDVETACRHFRESLALEATTGTRLNLAICEEQLGDRVRAWQLLDGLRHQMEGRDPRLALVEARLEQLESELARVTLRAHSEAPPTARARDAADGAPLPLREVIVLTPGRRAIIVDAPGHPPRRYELQLAAGSQQTLVISPGAAEVPAKLEGFSRAASPELRGPVSVPSEPMNVQSGSMLRPNLASVERTPDVATLLSVGIGAAALATSVVSAALILKERAVVERECTPLCSPAGLAAGGRGQTYSAVASISLIVGVAGVGLGAYFWLTEDVAAEATVRGDASQLALLGRF